MGSGRERNQVFKDINKNMYKKKRLITMLVLNACPMCQNDL